MACHSKYCAHIIDSAVTYLLSIIPNNGLILITDAPIVVIDPPESSHTVTVGTRLRLVCTATGQPIPTVQWFRRKTALTPIAQPFQQLLPVPTASPYKNREYTCVGISNAGNKRNVVRQKVTITVRGK